MIKWKFDHNYTEHDSFLAYVPVKVMLQVMLIGSYIKTSRQRAERFCFRSCLNWTARVRLLYSSCWLVSPIFATYLRNIFHWSIKISWIDKNIDYRILELVWRHISWVRNKNAIPLCLNPYLAFPSSDGVWFVISLVKQKRNKGCPWNELKEWSREKNQI